PRSKSEAAGIKGPIARADFLELARTASLTNAASNPLAAITSLGPLFCQPVSGAPWEEIPPTGPNPRTLDGVSCRAPDQRRGLLLHGSSPLIQVSCRRNRNLNFGEKAANNRERGATGVIASYQRENT